MTRSPAPRPRPRILPCLAFIAALWPANTLLGQAAVRAVFVANNGDLTGSVTSFTLGPDLAPVLQTHLVTGTRAVLTDPCAGCKAYEIALTPNGRYLAVAHVSGNPDALTILQVAADAAISQVLQINLPAGSDGPLDVLWLDDEYLAVLRAVPNPDQVAIYRFTPAPPSLSFLNAYAVGTGGSHLAIHPSRQYLYVNNSSPSPARQVYAFSVAAGGVLTQIDAEPTGTPAPFELAVSPNGLWLYAVCGDTGTGQQVLGLNIAPDGTLSPMPGSPFTTPSLSPTNLFVTEDNAYCVVGHAADALARVLLINPATGALSPTAHFFDVGNAGTLGDVRSMRDLLFLTDNSASDNGLIGLYSLTIGGGGALTPNGPIASSGGAAPRALAAWTPPIPGDADCDGDLDLDDVPAFVAALVYPPVYADTWPFCRPLRCDLNGDGLLDGRDIHLFTDALVP
mgnify:CR=1 FL=1